MVFIFKLGRSGIAVSALSIVAGRLAARCRKTRGPSAGVG